MKGKLIVIEGLDSSGKQTQSKLVAEKLAAMNYKVKLVSFPNYESDSSALVKMYLNGEISQNPDDINAYAASSFYAVDRYVSYKCEWEDFYLNGGVVIADRYTTSNMIHQGSKIDGTRIKNLYLDWLYDYEYKLLKLPVPNKVIFLDMPPETSRELMSKRPNKITGNEQKDIHERNNEYLERTYVNALYAANKFDWKEIFCVEEGQIRSIEDINNEIMKVICNDVFHRKYNG